MQFNKENWEEGTLRLSFATIVFFFFLIVLANKKKIFPLTLFRVDAVFIY